MEEHRAREIIASKGYINVNYKDKPVWIEYLNERDKTVHIKNMNSDEVYEVPAEELVEKHTSL